MEALLSQLPDGGIILFFFHSTDSIKALEAKYKNENDSK